MTTRLSNVAYLTVLPPAGLDGVGWTVRALSERDYQTVIADIPWFAGLGFTVEANETGGGSVTLDADAPVFTVPLPPAETARIVDQEALWQILEDGQVRFEFLAEDVDEDVVPDAGGPRTTVIAGRGTGSVLEWAPVLPAGMPAPASMSREFTAAPMAAWFQLFAEAQAAGFLGWVTLTFSAATDSRGVPWGPAQVLTVNAGDTLLDLLKRWAEINDLVWRMLPGFRLEVHQSGGLRLEDTVVFTQYRSQGEHKRKISRRELANVVYADSGDLGLAIAEDGASVTKWRKRAAWISAGDSGDASARSMVANTSLSLSKDQRLSRALRIIPDRVGRQPFVDFGVNDWIGVEVPDDDTESGARQVVGLAVQIDSAGVLDFEATLSTRFEVRAVKLQRLMDKLGASERSGSGGAAASPIPVSKSLSAAKLADLSDVDLTAPPAGALLQFIGGRWVDAVPNLDMLADVDTGTIPGSGEVSLILDRASGLWKPAVASGSGGGGAAVAVVGRFPPAPYVGVTLAAAGSSPSKGQRFTALADLTMTRGTIQANTTAGKTYRLSLYSLNAAGTATVSLVGEVAGLASPGTGTFTLDTGTVAWNLTGGAEYALLLSATDGTLPLVWSGGTTAAGSVGALVCSPPARDGYVGSVTAYGSPSLVLTNGTGSIRCDITAKLR